MSVKSNKKLNVSGMVRELDVDDNDSDWEKSDLSCMDSEDDEPLDHFIARSTELDALEEAQQCDFTANISTGSNQDTLLCPQSPQANNDHQCQSTSTPIHHSANPQSRLLTADTTSIADEDTSAIPSTSHNAAPLAQIPLFSNSRQFTQQVGAATGQPLNSTPLHYFSLIFGKQTIANIAQQTNLYASQKPPSDSYKWYNTNEEELGLFLDMLIAMGIHQLPSLEDYWSTDPLLGVPGITAGMSYKRFRAIRSSLHINDNTTAVGRDQPGFDRLHKVRPLLKIVNQNCLHTYNPSQNCSIDEAMVAFKGRSSLKQYIPLKPTKRGFKVWTLCDSANGYISNFQVYTGAQGSSPEYGLGGQVVKTLAQPFLDKNYNLFFDNYFSSVELLSFLSSHNTYCVATTQTKRKQWPKDLNVKELKDTMSRGKSHSVIVQTPNGTDVQCLLWMDKKCVPFVNTLTDPSSSATVVRKNKDGTRVDVDCPMAVKLYNKFMGGVDLADQRRKTQKEFHLEVAKELLSQHSSRKRSSLPTTDAPPSSCYCEKHFPSRGVAERQCKICRKNGRRKRTIFCCKSCSSDTDIHLCPTTCFEEFHIYVEEMKLKKR